MYSVWSAMRYRCNNADSKEYRYYGGRGIYVCESWQTFENFLADMAPRPDGLTIERINVNGSYTCGHCDDCVARAAPANCKWATSIEQGRNKRNNVVLTHDGRSQPMSAWVEETGIPFPTMWRRHRSGWTDEDTVTEPVGPSGPKRKVRD